MIVKSPKFSIEGDPVPSYLLIDKGTAMYIVNTLGDGWGPQRVTAARLSELRPVYHAFVGQGIVDRDYAPENSAGAQLLLIMEFEGGQTSYF